MTKPLLIAALLVALTLAGCVEPDDGAFTDAPVADDAPDHARDRDDTAAETGPTSDAPAGTGNAQDAGTSDANPSESNPGDAQDNEHGPDESPSDEAPPSEDATESDESANDESSGGDPDGAPGAVGAEDSGTGPAFGSGEVRITFADVDQGDGIIVEFPDAVLVVDSGRNPDSSHDGVTDYLNAQGHTIIDWFAVSHSDADHSGGCDNIFREYEVEAFIHPGRDKDTVTWRECLEAAHNEAGLTTMTDATGLDIGDDLPVSTAAKVTILNVDGTDPDHNEGSIALRIQHGDAVAILTGDIGTDTERDIMQAQDASFLRAGLLQGGHHGSKYSTGTQWLSVVDPVHVVFSVGENNYGHPTPEATSRAWDSGAHVYRTDEAGDVTFTSNGVAWSTMAAPSREPSATESAGDDSNDATGSGGDAGESQPVQGDQNTSPATGLGFERFQYDAPGSPDDSTNVHEEWVEICNRAPDSADLTGYQVRDAANNAYTFPATILDSDACLLLRTGSGTNTATDAYWGRSQHVWNQGGDTAYLYDTAGALVAEKSY